MFLRLIYAAICLIVLWLVLGLVPIPGAHIIFVVACILAALYVLGFDYFPRP